MIECALYSYVSSLKQIQTLRSIFKESTVEYDETVYSKADSLVIIRSYKKRTTVTKKTQVDKNRNRKYVFTGVEVAEAASLEGVMSIVELSGYELINKTKVEEMILKGKDFYVSVSREIENQKIVDNNLEKYWVLKVYSLSDSLTKAEEAFLSNIEKVECLVNLKKVDFNYSDK